MASHTSPSRSAQYVIYLLLSLFFSALPFLLALFLDKSSLTLGVFSAWYALLPPVMLLLLGWLMNRDAPNWQSFVGTVWIGIGIWFAVQYLLVFVSDFHILIAMLTMPSIMVGGVGVATGALVFLLGGLLLGWIGSRRPVYLPDREVRTRFLGSTISLLVLVFVVVPLFILITTRPATVVDRGPVPTEAEIFGWIEDVYNLGERRPGSTADLQAVEYLRAKLREFGFSEVYAEPISFDYWEPSAWRVTLSPGTQSAEELTSFYVPYSGPTRSSGITAELVDLGEGDPADFEAAEVEGKVILVDIPPVDITWDQQAYFSYMAFDPDQTASGWGHPYPVGWMFRFVEIYAVAEEHGAVGILGVLKEYPDLGEFTYYAPYDGTLRSIPSLYLTEAGGDRLRNSADDGPVMVELVLEASVRLNGGETATVYGVLPGRSATNIFFHTHHDAPWKSGVEDSSGVGMVLGLARYYAQIPQDQRERTMIFAFTGSHMVGAPDNEAFIEAHRDDIMANMLFDLAIEHIADDYNPPDSIGEFAEARGTFITENPVVISLYAGEVVEHGMYRTLLFPTGTPLGVPTDAGPFIRAGYPIVSLISGPTWLFDDDDTLERVARDQLVPLTEMYIDFVADLNRLPEALLHFNLNLWSIILVALVLTPLAVVSALSRTGVQPGLIEARLDPTLSREQHNSQFQ